MDIADYDYWRAELAQPGTRDRDDPFAVPCGFWRIVGADTGCDWPLAIWRSEEGRLRFLVGADKRNAALWDSEPGWELQTAGRWLKAVAVPEADWKAATANGQWGDGKPINSRREHSSLTNALPETGDPFTDLGRQFEDTAETARAIIRAGIKTAEDADQAAAFAKRLAEIGRRADTAHESEKRPWLDGGRQCDEKWRPLREGAAAAVKALKAAANAFLDAQRRAAEAERRRLAEEAERQRREAEEAERKAAAERAAVDAAMAAAQARAAAADQATAEAERQRIAELEAARQAADAAAAERQQAAAAAAAEAARPVSVSAGRTGAKIAQRKVVTAEIVDYPAALAHFADSETVRAEIQRLANIAVKSGMSVPGCRRLETFQTV